MITKKETKIILHISAGTYLNVSQTSDLILAKLFSSTISFPHREQNTAPSLSKLSHFSQYIALLIMNYFNLFPQFSQKTSPLLVSPPHLGHMFRFCDEIGMFCVGLACIFSKII